MRLRHGSNADAFGDPLSPIGPMRLAPVLVAAAVVSFCASAVGAQTPPPNAAQDTTRPDLLRVYLDCRSGCDEDFFRTEIAWLNFVRDRQLAQVQLLITTQQTGAGGREYTLTFLGQGDLASRADTTAFSTQPTATSDEVRRQLVRVAAQGLLKFVRGSPIALQIDVVFRAPAGQARTDTRGSRDRWNLWVFRISSNVNSSGDKNYRQTFSNSSISANRITAQWKISLRASGSYEESRFVLSDSETVTNYQRNFNSDELVVKSINDHWSFGVQGNAGSSKFRNQDFTGRIGPAIEYDLFPYSQSTRRQVIVRYGPGIRTFNYIDTTIYGKLKETHPDHRLVVASSIRQSWGDVFVSSTSTQFLHDMSKRNFEIFASINWRIVAGLSFNMFGEYSQIHDQLYLPKGSLTDQDVLIRLRQLQTSYSYFIGGGLSYTFGSIFNNVVNPRFAQ